MNALPEERDMNDFYETPQFDVEEIKSHDAEYVTPLPRRTNYGVNGFAVQGRRDMLHHYAAQSDEVRKLREALLPMTKGTAWLTEEHVSAARAALGSQP